MQPDTYGKHLSAFSISPTSHWGTCKARSKHRTLVQEFLFSEKHILYLPVQQNFRCVAAATRILPIAGSTSLYSFANVSLAANASFQAGSSGDWLAAFAPTKRGDTVLEALHSNLLTVSPVGAVGRCAPASHPDIHFIPFELSLHSPIHCTS